MRNYYADYSRYSFIAEEDWGDYDKGKYRKPWFNELGYSIKNYLCSDGKWHAIAEHVAKWEYFNGEIPDGLQIDHIIPIKNGGTNKLSNLRIVTHKENSNNELSRKNQSLAKLKLWENDEYRDKIILIHSSDDYKEKQSISHKGKKGYVNKDICKQVFQYEDDKLINIYESICDAARQTGYNKERIRTHCLDNKKYKGYKWSYEPL